MPQRITSHLGRAPLHVWSDDSDAPADHPHLGRAPLHVWSDDHLASRQSALACLEWWFKCPSGSPRISAEHPHTSGVMIRMPQRITSHLGRAPSHLWSDAPTDHLASRQSALTSLGWLFKGPSGSWQSALTPLECPNRSLHISTERPRMSRVMIQMPQRITSQL